MRGASVVGALSCKSPVGSRNAVLNICMTYQACLNVIYVMHRSTLRYIPESAY